ncbi:phosphatase PAP2 family protein [Mycobacterium lacus]|uniref:Membrane protein n=1 Tax=Mycobacterium lacus TaxID=169765 RepID=A0A7I7NS12_9MYCO|nr:phosphatase PAP2 family protein [Mycobacterium lacus]MCV7121582.1 phosphatase PAP2 family protein [Mycobacterium lacus]BBX98591.1 membrane protein [Mycobacterium lacus]
MNRPRTTLALSLALAATVVYAVMWVGHTQHWWWLHGLDWSVLDAAHDIGIKSPAWVQLWDGVSFALGPVPLRLLGLLVVVVSLVRREVRLALLLLFCAPLNGLMTWAAKSLAGRPRPVTALVAAHSTSFPSGHALEAMASVLALLVFLLPIIGSPLTRAAAIALGALSVLMVGIARVALNVHHPSDVIAGWALGYLYFLVCLWVFRPPLKLGDPLSQRGDPTGSKHLLDPEVGTI